ncbi:MAG: hypothetical protein RLZZ200_2818 [Pseudomonadota bacterium]
MNAGIAALSLAASVICLLLAAWRTAPAVVAWFGRRHEGFADGDLADLFIFVPVRRLSAVLWLGAAGILVLLYAVGLPWPFAGAAATFWLVAPRGLLGFMRRRRQRRLYGQLPDGIALLAGLLRAGHGLAQGLELIAGRQPAPLGQELHLLVRKHRLGVPLDQALQEFADRVPEPDVALLVLAIRVSREVGGNLAESLHRLGEGVRSRVVLRERIGALTAQGKLQGIIIGFLPLFLMAVLAVIDPGPMGWLFQTRGGWVTLSVIAALELTGFFLIRRIVRIDL